MTSRQVLRCKIGLTVDPNKTSISTTTTIIIISFLQLLRGIATADRITPDTPIAVNETIISSGKNFALGFFNSLGNLYVGIWYNSIPGPRTVVWVANRDRPLKDSAGVFTVTQSGNLAILDAKGMTYWSSNTSNGTAAVLFDTGNLILLGNGGASSLLWQSFDDPTDTLLTGMRLESNSKMGVVRNLVSWRGDSDPSPGEFSFGVDPRTLFQIVTWKGSDPYWRRNLWNGRSLSDTNGSVDSVLRLVRNDTEAYINFSSNDPGRYLLDSTGRLKMMYWEDSKKNWKVDWHRPESSCDLYDHCGPNGICDNSYLAQTCSCLQGFQPHSQKDWEAKNWSGGCVRMKPLSCDNKGDVFFKLPMMKLPDQQRLTKNTSSTACETECVNSCECVAYTFVNATLAGSLSSCMIWGRDLMDLEQLTNKGENLYVRLVASELHNNTNLLVIALLTVAITGLILLGILSCLCWRRFERQKKRSKVSFGELRFSNLLARAQNIFDDVPQFNFSAVQAATNNFTTSNRLGQGGFGPVYMGRLSQGEIVAVKRLSKSSRQGLDEFKNEVNLIARLQHKNLVKLLGWCVHENENILIYEYLSNKSLDNFIFDSTQSGQLDWAKRYHIIEGIAQGLLYLHQYSRLRIIHRDLKASNILLDDSMNPKISDFGLARIFGGTQKEANTERVVGTYGYMSPEYALGGLFSEKSDVFSFGVIVLEIITGKRSTGFYLYDQSLNLLGYAWKQWEEGRSLDLSDPCMGTSFISPEVARCIQIGLLCVQDNPADRPTMSSVVSMLGNENLALPLPKQSTFVIEKNPSAMLPSSSNSKSSVNEVTISIVEGR